MNYINMFKKQKLIIVSSVSLSPQLLMIRVLEGSSSITYLVNNLTSDGKSSLADDHLSDESFDGLLRLRDLDIEIVGYLG